jgi:hypothetical protein
MLLPPVRDRLLERGVSQPRVEERGKVSGE